jgi:autotransporter-associated beta strand protein
LGTGTLRADNGASRLRIAGDVTDGDGVVNNVVIAEGVTLRIEVDDGRNATFSGLVSDEGAGGNLIKDSAGTLTLAGVNTYIGDTTVQAGTLNLADDAGLKFVITGTGETTHSNWITGTSSGTVLLNGDFTFDLPAEDVIVGDMWRIVDVDNLATTFNDSFTVVDFTGGEGAGVLWSGSVGLTDYQFSEATGILTVLSTALLGDTNSDGVVDAVDYIALKTNFGVTEGATLAMGNFDAESDGNVDWDDLQILLANFGTRSVGGAPAVTPEPATLGLLAIGALAILRRRRRS